MVMSTTLTPTSSTPGRFPCTDYLPCRSRGRTSARWGGKWQVRSLVVEKERLLGGFKNLILFGTSLFYLYFYFRDDILHSHPHPDVRQDPSRSLLRHEGGGPGPSESGSGPTLLCLRVPFSPFPGNETPITPHWWRGGPLSRKVVETEENTV